MIFEIISQICIAQQDNLYAVFADKEAIAEFEQMNESSFDLEWYNKHSYSCPDTSMLYDFLKNEGKVDLDLPEEDKKIMWKLAVEKYNREHKDWIKTQSKEWNKEQLNRVYKSFIIRKVFGDKYYKEGLKMDICNEFKWPNGERLQRVKWSAEK